MESISDYELNRLARIRENHAKLVELGLASDDDDAGSILISSDYKKAKRQKTELYVEPSSRVLRSRGDTEHMQLSDEFTLAEEAAMDADECCERMSVKSSTRGPKRIVYYSDTQANEILTKQDVMLHNHAAKMAEEQHYRAAQRQNVVRSISPKPLVNALAPVTALPQPPPPVYQSAERCSYFTQGETAVCPDCEGIFVLKKSGVMRKHRCVKIVRTEAPSVSVADFLPDIGSFASFA